MLARDTEIEALVAALHDSPWLALDTEADSLHAYPEKLCLIQLTHIGGDVLVDPLSPADLTPLLRHLGTRALILHGADFDLRLLRRTRGFVAREVFDTAIAAQLLGRPRHGLRDLVRELLGVELSKGSQRADWSRRPLSPQMLAYAVNDTRYLASLREQLEAQLIALGRLAWHTETCARLVETCAVVKEPDPDAWRIKGSNQLDARGLAVLRELWRWREATARARDRPPYFILSHEHVLELAARAAHGDHLSPVSLPPVIRSHDRGEVEHAIARALALPAAELPARASSVRPPQVPGAVQRRIDALRTRRDRRAADLAIDPSLIATRTEIAALAEDWDRGAAALMTWQAALLAP
jgi:ribonuclease D